MIFFPHILNKFLCGILYEIFFLGKHSGIFKREKRENTIKISIWITEISFILGKKNLFLLAMDSLFALYLEELVSFSSIIQHA